MSIIRLTTRHNLQEAHMIRHQLENEGISCFLSNENFTSLMPGYTEMMGSGVHVMIEEEDLERASAILNEIYPEKPVQCPRCDSQNVTPWTGKHKLLLLGEMILNALTFSPFRTNKNIQSTWTCLNCGYRFRHDAP